MENVLAGAACSIAIAVAGWVFTLGNRVTKLETSQGHGEGSLKDIKETLGKLDGKIDSVLLAMASGKGK